MALDWVETQVKPKFMQRAADGQLVSVTMYYDPVIGHDSPGGTGIGLGVAFYLLPYRPPTRLLPQLLVRARMPMCGTHPHLALSELVWMR